MPGPVVAAVRRAELLDLGQYWWAYLPDNDAMLGALRAMQADRAVPVPLTRMPDFLRRKSS